MRLVSCPEDILFSESNCGFHSGGIVADAVYDRGATESLRGSAPLRGWIVLRTLIAVLLLFAAEMKARQLSDVSPPVGNRAADRSLSSLDGRVTGLSAVRLITNKAVSLVLKNPLFLFLFILFELFFAACLISGIFPRQIWMATIILFAFFCFISLIKALAGEASCGCFGNTIRISPWYMALLDLAVVIGLCFCKAVRFVKAPVSVRRILAAAAIWTVAAVPVFSAFLSHDAGSSVLLGTEYTRGDGRRTILLEPDKWPEGEFPLLPFIEPAEVRSLLKSGSWTVVIYRNGCPKCREVKDFLAGQGAAHVIFLEILPCEGEGFLPSGFVHANLSDKFAWSVDTPMIFQVGENSFKQLSIQTLLEGVEQ